MKRDDTAFIKEEANLLVDAGIKFEWDNYGHSSNMIIIREHENLKIDYFPFTGRWRYSGRFKPSYKADAKRFIRWYKKKVEELVDSKEKISD